MNRRPWSRDELLIAFRLYCGTPFGKLHQHNPEIIELARLLGRTPSAVGMKACNFASLDPAQQARGIRGLSARSKADEQLWAEFAADAESVAAEAEAAWESMTVAEAASVRSEADDEATRTLPASRSLADALGHPRTPSPAHPVTPPAGPTETERTLRARRVQRFFRNAVLVSYDTRCALTGLAVPDLLTASHIIPWSQSEPRRADPRNGLCLNALHDRAFDRGLLTFDEDL